MYRVLWTGRDSPASCSVKETFDKPAPMRETIIYDFPYYTESADKNKRLWRTQQIERRQSQQIMRRYGRKIRILNNDLELTEN